MDVTCLLFRSTEHVKKFKKYLNKQHKKISRTSEMEQNGSLPFLDIKVNHENNKFVTSVYRKPTFSGFFTNFESFISKYYKRSLIDVDIDINIEDLVYAPTWKSFIKKLVL